MLKKYHPKFLSTNQIIIILLLLAVLFTSKGAKAQCTAPTAATVTATAAACQGEGRVVAKITNPAAGASYQYQLQYDSTGNTSVVKPWQPNDTFYQVAAARYKVYIRRVCGAGFSTEYISASTTVTTSTTALSVTQAIPLTKSSCGNGSLRVTAAGGNTIIPYQYALIPSLNAIEPITNYVRPQQPVSTFSGLPAGTYFARVYDGCGTFSSATIVIDSVAENVVLSSQNPGGYTFYGCDSIRVSYSVMVNNKLPPNPASPSGPILALPEERFWVTSNGVTDTLPNAVNYFYTPVTGNSQTTLFKTLQSSYPMNVTYGYKSTCGNIYTRNVVIIKPNLKVTLSANSLSCTEQRYMIITSDSISGNAYNYVNTRLSLDLGATWSALNVNAIYTDTFAVGSTTNIWVASACDTAKVTVTAVLPNLNVLVSQFTSFSCNGNSGFGVQATGYSGNVDSIKFNVLSQPAGANLPDSFYMIQMSGSNGSASGFLLSYNVPPGTYTIKATDRCGATQTYTRIFNPTTVAFTASPLLSCLPSQSGFRLTVTETNYQPYFGYSYLRAIVTNTATGHADSFLSASQTSRPTTIDVIGIPNGDYTIRVIKVRPPTLPYPACSVNGVYTNTANQPLSLTQSTFTSACSNGTATVAGEVLGGGGGNQFYLDQQGAGSTWTQVAGPQASPVFNNLLSNNVYRIRVTDACGNGTQYTTSFSNAAPSLEFSSTMAPCPGDAFTMNVDPNPAAVYAWQKNSAPIAGATTAAYTLNPVPAVGAPIDTYKVRITYGNCDYFSSSYAVNPVLCNTPLPLYLRSFNGFFNAQDKVQLRWEVMHAEKVRSFDVEYSGDGVSFRKAGTQVSNNSPLYQYTDDKRMESRLFYRLKMISTDGEATYSAILKLNRKGGSDTQTLKIYPTLVTNNIHISYSASEEEQLRWKIMNIQGSTVRSGTFVIGKGVSSFTINGLSDIAAGNYILSLSGASVKHSEKIVIQK